MVVARRTLASAFLIGSLVLSSSAGAKEFRPGDLSVCNAKRCVSIKSQPVLAALSRFYYDSAVAPPRARGPRLGVPFYRLQFSNGYVTGIVAGAELGRVLGYSDLSRFLSYGVNLDQFASGAWYRVPARAVAGLRKLTVGLAPLRLTDAALADSPRAGVQSSATEAPRSARPAGSRGGRGSLAWVLGVLSLGALLALASIGGRRRRSAARLQPTPRLRWTAASRAEPAAARGSALSAERDGNANHGSRPRALGGDDPPRAGTLGLELGEKQRAG